MKANYTNLVFRDVDGLAFAAARHRLDVASLAVTYVAHRLGPVLELLHLSAGGRIPRPGKWIAFENVAAFVAALEQSTERWVSPTRQDTGLIRANRSGPDADTRFTDFLMTAKRAGRRISGLSPAISAQLVAAMAELENNIHDHANATETGVLAYKAEPGLFEFVAADRGIGILRSLRQCESYAALADEGEALRAALTDGVSRHGLNSRQGHGFRPIFTGLANLRSELRFRSGDHAITMDGTNPDLSTARIRQKALIDGFFASVTCYAASEMGPEPHPPASSHSSARVTA